MRNKLISIIGVFLLVFFAATPVFSKESKASAENGAGLADYVIDNTRTGTLDIEYKNEDKTATPVAGAEFTVYMIGTLNKMGGYDSLIEGIKKFDRDSNEEKVLKAVKKAYADNQSGLEHGKHTGTTNKQGFVDFANLPLGLYIVEESAPAKGYIASTPFFAALPYKQNGGWAYALTAYPKPKAMGALQIEKTVKGNAGETDREFHFVVTFSIEKEKFPYTISSGATGEIKSGQSIALKSGEKAVIEGLPSGTKYKVKEKEENKDGYSTKSTGTSDTIEAGKTKKCSFVNSKNREDENGDKKKDEDKNGGGGSSGSGGSSGGGGDSSGTRAGGAQTGDSNRILILGGTLFILFLIFAMLIYQRIELKKKEKSK